jgi:hypothetical protein
MLTAINPKLPMRDKSATRNYYINQLGFTEVGTTEYEEYLMVKKDNVEIHFFKFKELDSKENYGGVYIRTDNIDQLYQELNDRKVPIHTIVKSLFIQMAHCKQNHGDKKNLHSSIRIITCLLLVRESDFKALL